MSSSNSDALTRAAQRAEQQPFFLASVLAAYRAAHQLDDTGLANMLGCATSDLIRLALCRRPAADSAQFSADVDHLARRFGLHSDRLAAMIRQVDALTAIKQQLEAAEPATGLLRAARDRAEPASSEEFPND
ncbi:hypothetical protein [Chloroflexus sp.]|uniref:hypothetical protein n=1 Tax=Chloroflexus sp. TaxID=1904827 RepID=UPI002ACEB565|nr:hypothetical protein [Chloroflexus sp.]